MEKILLVISVFTLFVLASQKLDKKDHDFHREIRIQETLK